NYGVSGNIYALRSAYDDVKNGWMTLHGHPDVGLTHGELHILYLSALFLFGLAALSPYSLSFALSCGVVLIVAFLADTRQHIREARVFKRANLEIVEFLKSKYYI